MANNGVSQHFKINGGLDVSSDSQFATLSANTKIVYKPSGEKYIKNPNYSNVFDKTNAIGDLETEIKAQAVRRIENSGNPDGTTNYYSIDGTKLGSFISGVSPKDLSDSLGNVRSTSISAIGDADKTSGVCSCKNASGSEVDTFTCHVSKTANNPTLSWGQQATIGTVDGTTFKVTMPANPNTDTKYYAGTGLSLSGTTFNHNNYMDPQPDYYHPCVTGISLSGNVLSITGLSIRFNQQGHVTGYKNADAITVDLSSIAGSDGGSSGGGENWETFYYKSGNLSVGDIVSGSELYYSAEWKSPVGTGSWKLMFNQRREYTYWVSEGGSGHYETEIYYEGLFQKVG